MEKNIVEYLIRIKIKIGYVRLFCDKHFCNLVIILFIAMAFVLKIKKLN